MKIFELLIESEVYNNKVYLIPVENMGFLNTEIDKLNKKATKLGSSPIVLTNLGKEDRNEDGSIRRFFKIKVTGRSPKINGWRLIAALDHVNGENVIRVVPSETLPLEYRNASPTTCDYCHTKRDRVNSYIVANDSGETQQIGRSCLRNFLGHKDPKTILYTASVVSLFDNLMDQVSNQNKVFGGGKIGIDIITYLSYVAACIKKNGWLPKSASDNPTAYQAIEQMMLPFTSKNKIHLTQNDIDLAENAIKWVRETLPNKRTTSDYEHNIIIIGKKDTVNDRHLGFAASIIPAYTRAKERELERKRQAETPAIQTSNYVGKVGERFGSKGMPPLKLQLVSVRWIDGTYGSTGIHKFVDENGNFFIWFASSDPGMEIGNWYTIAATIKNHQVDKYNNNAKTTYITRAKVF